MKRSVLLGKQVSFLVLYNSVIDELRKVAMTQIPKSVETVFQVLIESSL